MRKILSALLLLCCAVATAHASYQTITNDVFYLTTNGTPVYTQGGGISKFGNTYYWYGIQYSGMATYYAHPTSGNATANTGFVAINCYSSPDMVHWTFQNQVISTKTANFTTGLGWVGRMGCVVYNSTTQQYVMWFQYTGPAGSGQACCTCSSPTGNFTLNNVQTAITNVFDSVTGDCTIFCDVDHGSTPYLVFSDSHGREHLYVSSLSANYTAINPATLISEWPQGQEANNMFVRNGLYYACMSNLAGWSYSSAYQVNSPSIQTPADYTSDATFAGTDLNDTYYSQISFVVPVAGSLTTSYILVGDRWSQNDSSYLSAGHGLGFNIMGPLTFNGTTPTFVPLASFQLDAVTGNWRATPAFATPTGLTATPGAGNVTLSWDASGNATNYTVQRATAASGPYSLLASNLTSTTDIDATVTNGTTYYYEVAAVNGSTTSAYSLPVSAIPSAAPAPAAPGELTATAGNAQVALAWDPSTGATSYTVQRATAANGPYATLASGLTSTTYTDTTATYGPTYYYEIVATTGAATSTNSVPVSVQLTGNITWTGAASGNWDTTTANWLSGVTPAVYLDGDNVTFTDSAANTSITIGNPVNPASITFANSSSNYTIGGAGITGAGGVTLAGTGTVTLTGSNSYLGLTTLGSGATLIVGNATTLQGSTVNLSSGTLSFAATITSATLGGLQGTNPAQNLTLASTAGAVALTVGGNNATTTYSGNLSGTGSVTKSGTGAVTLSNVNYSGATTVNAGTLTITGALGSSGNPAGAITASGGTLKVNGAAVYAPSLTQNSNGGNVFLTAAGTISLSGALGVNADNDDDDGVVSLASGTLSAASATIGRDGDNLGATAPAAGSTTDGLYVDGATVTIATTLSVGYFNGAENSSGQMRVDAGSVTVGGITTIANDAGSRFSLLDINGGTFTDNDTSGTGILVGGAADASLDAELLVRGTATLNTPAITLGNGSDTGGLLEFMALGGTTYLGAGGIASTAPVSTTVTVALGSAAVATAPVIAASAGWSSSRPMTLTNNSAGAAVTFQAANASGTPENITLGGALSGTGGLTKTGAGTLTLSGINTYTGTTTVSAGTFNLTGSLAGAALIIQSGATLGGGGNIAAPLTVQSGGGLLLNSSGNPAVTGNVALNGTVVVTAAANLSVGNYTLLSYGGALSGSPVFTYVPPSGTSQAATFSTATPGVITVTVFGPPAAPTGLVATPGSGNVTLNWTASSGATGYTVQRSTISGSGYTTLATNVSATTYKDSTVSNGTTYYYVVVATNAGSSSGASTQSGATPQPPAPAMPTGLTATAGNGNVTLNWTAVSGATSYTVQRSTTSGTGYSTVNGSVATNNYTDLGLANGTTYYYVVAAANGGGLSPNSAEVSATPAQTLTQWTSTAFPGQTDPAIIGPTANPSGDGIPNLLKYFFGLNPATNAGSAPVTSTPDHSGNLVISFPLAKNLTGVTYQIQSSPDLTTWTNTGVLGAPVSDQGTYYQMQATVPLGTNATLSLRVSVTQTP